ncbi:bifunctional rhamnulose-1-phosphate aldolase/short-chain dehydrogenase [Eilatimonas milleporae]|uniref:Rhamnulose-1-phosphate aldolase/alcohol dehydrogenase n=1 Tax=Eilatimonas milleporae TaxID=911205 RepID=A0A3M0CS64_9PROT|nr:bifunctional rhamnulose-1-phosphate aldolase/short-chain dehydrogenase [Eilatimonas milleporae]RMB12431.1 rhamnulose-1-phosphate aldolase/alcohol dehydrogenase [Eilatimonas milleporae]
MGIIDGTTGAHGSLMALPENRWDASAVEGASQSDLLLYRSNLLGADLTVTNFGGGNTSAKVMEVDPFTGAEVEILWVKGSGGDLGSMKRDGFATLYQDRLLMLEGKYRGLEHEDEMVGYLPHATFNLNPRAASIDTPLHAYLPFRHVDHMHPDAVIAIAAAKGSEDLTKEIFGAAIGWLPWQRPGFDLGLRLRDYVRDNPGLNGIVLESHGLFTWGDTARGCYENTLAVIRRATECLNARIAAKPAFGGTARSDIAPADRAARAAKLMPLIRARISTVQPKLGHFNDAPEILEFVNSADMQDLAAIGTSCPDHFLRTKIRPLVIDADKALAEDGGAYLDTVLGDYRDFYAGYYARCRRDTSPAMRDANPVVYLVPGVGMVTFAGNKATARIAGEFYVNAINVMRGATALSDYVGLPEQEAFDIEYWLLEEAKLQRMPKPKALAGKVAMITGGAGGIGKACARRFLREGACVVLSDIDADALDAAEAELAGTYSADLVRTVPTDVTSEEAVARSMLAACRAYGGVDILVANAGIAASAPLEETTLDMWRKTFAILSEGYFLAARAVFSQMKTLGGSIVMIGSKNALAASPNASAYCAAKASELHLARCLALEGAAHGIRVNVVNPDAVLSGSKIWTGKWRRERAAAYALREDELEEHYRRRSMLQRNVFPEDIAEAVYFWASDASAKSTGNIINVDAGNAAAFTR